MRHALLVAAFATLAGCAGSVSPGNQGNGIDNGGENGGNVELAVVTALVERGDQKELVEVSTAVYCDGEEIGTTGDSVDVNGCREVTVGDMSIADQDDDLPVFDDGDNGLWASQAKSPSEDLVFVMSRYIPDGTGVTCAYLSASCYDSGDAGCQYGEVEYSEGNTLENIPLASDMQVDGSFLENEYQIGEFTSPVRWTIYDEDPEIEALECWVGSGDARYN